MLPGLEHMLVNLTDAADRAHCSALVQPSVQGLKLRSKKSTKARAFLFDPMPRQANQILPQ
jgi:hypothetical protein